MKRSIQALRFHGNDRFWYRVATVILKYWIRKKFPVTYPDIFRLRDQNTQIEYFSTQILN